MQVFVPIADSFQASIACLDYKRLGKQRVECQQILASLKALRIHPSGCSLPVGWTRHPATLMWQNYESALGVYMTMCVMEWTARGYKNNMMTPYNPETFRLHPGWIHDGHYVEDGREAELPSWWGREDVHASHRGRLLDKDPEWYGQYSWVDQPRSVTEGYVWPV